MPQKVCGGRILHVMAFFLKCPKIEHSHFGFFSRFRIDHVLFSRNTPLFMFENLEMPHFQNQMGKMGNFRNFENKKIRHFEKKARDRFENEKRTQNEYVRFWGISGKMHHMQNISST